MPAHAAYALCERIASIVVVVVVVVAAAAAAAACKLTALSKCQNSHGLPR